MTVPNIDPVNNYSGNGSVTTFDKLSNKQIKRLVELLDKIKTTENPNKKKQHIKGFKIGTMFLKTLGEKLLGAYEILEKELNAFEGGKDDNNT